MELPLSGGDRKQRYI